MEGFYRPTWAEISLDALEWNWSEFRRVLPNELRMMAVVKANAYGHGAVQVAEQVLEQGADYLGVAFLDEALNLRKAGITASILVLGYTSPEGIDLAIDHDITLNVFSQELLAALQAREPSTTQRLKVHVKIDSGMGRIGLREQAEAVTFIEELKKLPHVHVEGLFTHFATADHADKSYVIEQYEHFAKLVDNLHNQGIDIPYIHAGNSAAAIDTPELSFNMVRIGVALYGLYPSEEVKMDQIKLKPVMSVKTKIALVKTLPTNSGISYGLKYRTKGDEQIASLPLGYADGYSRRLNGQVDVLVQGQRVPIVGSICMDQCMINVSGIQNAAVGDEVVILGAQGNERITAEELAAKLGTINYEVGCMIASRVPRVYVKRHKVVKVVNALWEG
ncbi:alanine racemase [Paenibacillus albiflavus]|uniref:Alanine racemase n=1 Tax=Paenibacillus albiflavus TaxID=2545760 RepID=A0A4R4EBP5_9BACL|nr:alanine racemase [Paenibacillus albiflavus]TCZ76553.1 alanine racemase [Paenibacillus albiflavus]